MIETPRKKPSRRTLALALISTAFGIDLLQAIHQLLTNPINLLETYSHGFLLGSAFGAVCIGAGAALLVHLSPKIISKTRVLYLGLLTTLLTTVLMLRICLDLSRYPLSTVLIVLGIGLMLSAGSSTDKTHTPLHE